MEEEKQILDDPKENKNILIKTKIISIIKDFLKMFLKIYGIRIIFSFFNFFRRSKKIFSNFTFNTFLKIIFNLPNLRTSLSIALLPFLFKIIKIILNNISFFEKNSDFITFIAGFVSGLISIIIEEKTKLVNYIILSIMVRVIHSIILIIFKQNKLFQNTGKVWDYFIFLFAAIFIWSIYFLNPGYTPITSLFDSYANYRNENEKLEAIAVRNSTRIV